MRKLSDFSLLNASAIHRMRIRDVAEQTHTIASTVVRFAKRYGFVGFSDFKLAFLQEAAPSERAMPVASVRPKPEEVHAALWELESSSACVLALADLVNTSAFQQAVQWILVARRIGLLARSAEYSPPSQAS